MGSSSIRFNRRINFSWLMLLLGAVLFYLSNPCVLFPHGLGILSFASLVPVFLCVRNSSFKDVWLKGFLYGALSYALYCYWLYSFNPLTMLIAILFYSVILSFVFLLLKASDTFSKKYSFFFQAVVWCAYEYVKTLGFLGFSYGVIGYTQWKNSVLLQNASWGGVWSLSLFCALLCAVLCFFITERKIFVKKIPVLLSLAYLCFCLTWGGISLSKEKNRALSNKDFVKVVCVQNNTDSSKYGVDVYKRDIANLKSLTASALKEHPDTKIVIWPETAVVPPVEYHYGKRTDSARLSIITDLLEFIEGCDCVFVIGNQRTIESGLYSTQDFNSALIFNPSKNNVIPPQPFHYEKVHLVPFVEHFPYKKMFPSLYKALLNGSSQMWTAGNEYMVFEENALKFSTPICFEDTFGNDCRNFVLMGARCLFNLSNDSWSKSVPCQNQHLAMATFRCVENRICAARSTASGTTAFVDSCGNVVSETEPFEKNYLAAEVPVQDKNFKITFYTKHGDFLAKIILLCAVLIETSFLLRRFFCRRHGNQFLRLSGH